MLKLKIFSSALAALGLSAAMMTAAAAQDVKWPTRTVNVIIPWAAGGGTDPLARIIFGDLEKRLGQAFPLDFRPGAAGTIGAANMTKAEPDGYTLMFTSGSPAVNANFMKNVSYNPKTDLVPIVQVTAAPTYIVANANTPYSNFQELVDFAKKNPGKINAAYTGVSDTVVTVQYRAGVQFTVVPYGGTGALQADLMAGTVDISFGFAAGFMSGVKGGKLKFIASMAPQRDSLMTNVPATDESAYKGVYRSSWFMAFAPKGTPQPLIDKINAELRATVADPEVAKRINGLGYTVVVGSQADAANLIKRETDDMKQLVDAGVIKVE